MEIILSSRVHTFTLRAAHNLMAEDGVDEQIGLIRQAVVQSENAESAYFTSKQILPFRFAKQSGAFKRSLGKAGGRVRDLDTLSPFKHCRVTLKFLPERQFRLNETSNHFMQGEGGGRGRGRPLAVGIYQHTAWQCVRLRVIRLRGWFWSVGRSLQVAEIDPVMMVINRPLWGQTSL